MIENVRGARRNVAMVRFVGGDGVITITMP
jgi:hypothetical protein